MRTKIARNRAVTHVDDMEAARQVVTRLVREREITAGSRETAYRQVATDIGKGYSWVRRLMAGTEPVVVRRCTWLNIVAAYTALCERIEAAADHERRLEELLRGKEHASAGGCPGLVARPTVPDRGGAAP